MQELVRVLGGEGLEGVGHEPHPVRRRRETAREQRGEQRAQGGGVTQLQRRVERGEASEVWLQPNAAADAQQAVDDARVARALDRKLYQADARLRVLEVDDGGMARDDEPDQIDVRVGREAVLLLKQQQN